jgi:AraC-like DNA-binding protein
MDVLNTVASDSLAVALNAINVRSSVYCLSELRAPWGFRVDDAPIAKFHLVLEGMCWLEPDDGDPVKLRDGDLVILPGGIGHVMRDEPGSSVLGLDSMIAAHPLDASARLAYGGTGLLTRLLCGGFGMSDVLSVPLLSHLPPVTLLDGVKVSDWVGPFVSLVRHEADHAAPGSQAILAKLADLLLCQAVRAYLTETTQDGLLGAERDAQVERATRLLSEHPDRPWTLQLLAREVGMSRTLLAARFRSATGISPMRYLARIRLSRAAGYLNNANLSVEAIAKRTGYTSSSSLSKAFKREFGIPPGAYRNADITPVQVQELSF